MSGTRASAPLKRLPTDRRFWAGGPSFGLFLFVLLGSLFALVYAEAFRKSPVACRVGFVTNEFGVPIAEVTISNSCAIPIFYECRLEAFRDRWTELDGPTVVGSLAPGQNDAARFGHPIPEGMWRVRIWWMAHPVHRRFYFRFRQVMPRVARLFQRDGFEFTEPIKAWQPPELR